MTVPLGASKPRNPPETSREPASRARASPRSEGCGGIVPQTRRPVYAFYRRSGKVSEGIGNVRINTILTSNGPRGDGSMRLLLTNDDGIDAPGLAALSRAVAGLGFSEVVIVAPSGPRSGCGHTVTTHQPLTASKRSETAFAVSGTPADCTRLALHHLARNVDWVFSGINDGGNLGGDVYISGTAAAAREAAFHGVPSVAISHFVAKGRVVDWDVAANLAARILGELMSRPVPSGFFWNVNLPHPLRESAEPPWLDCPLDPSPLPLAYRVEGERAEYIGVYHQRTTQAGGDVDVCFSGRVAVSRIWLASS